MSYLQLLATRKNPVYGSPRPLLAPTKALGAGFGAGGDGDRGRARVGVSVGEAEEPAPNPALAADLRRRRSRSLSDRLVARSEHLMPEDRALIRSVFRDGVSAQALAQAARVAPRRTRQRVRALVRRMLTHRYVFVLAHRESWPANRRRVATACALQGRSIRECAAHLRLSVHQVRRELAAVRALEEADGQAGGVRR